MASASQYAQARAAVDALTDDERKRLFERLNKEAPHLDLSFIARVGAGPTIWEKARKYNGDRSIAATDADIDKLAETFAEIEEAVKAAEATQ